LDINGDSIWTIFYDKNGKELNYIPEEVQEMFRTEFGISVTYNAETQMMGFGEVVNSKLSQSNTATEILSDALQDDNSREKGFMKHGKINFGYNIKDETTGNPVNEGSWTCGVTNIDLADFDSKTGKSKVYDYIGVPVRSHNLARAFEEEYLGHNYLKSSFDGDAYGLSKVNQQVNIYMQQRGLPQRLNYSDQWMTTIYYGNVSDYASRKDIRKAVIQMVKGTLNPKMYLKKKE
jgi:hypothetical protein